MSSFGGSRFVHRVEAAPERLPDRWLVREVDYSGASEGEGGSLLRLLAEAFSFPDYFGHNWDAAEECLGDLSWLPAEGYALILRAPHALPEVERASLERFVAVWEDAAAGWAREGVPFQLYLITAPFELPTS